ncbi:DUF4197 domain-containing protein [Azonexus sp.]|jgi:hypothetical protein|uniref:DUF4197 domain-containing protein n=1 Tax=Azonexus sp. TaxID=1872668 RepID=UPI00282AA3F0|nr:DUF4197 domain-containing protein [Azonexus sp.]MDR1995787.1 DUF4197 domain-containing protein [Azonexus sp.]
MRRLLVPLFALLLAGAATLAQAAGLDAISSGDASAGVKEALAKGADVAITSLGKKDGFLGNAKVKIPLPGTLQKAEKGLRMLGMGKQADELVNTMNHAAENAVAEARPILTDAIKKMTVRDAKDILTGGDDSVTQYFKRSSAEQLTQKFLPIVKTATGKLQLAEQYNSYAGKAASLGLIDGKDADINAYVTQKAMDGLFLMIAEEEKKLRANPVAAGSALLKKVFGAL